MLFPIIGFGQTFLDSIMATREYYIDGNIKTIGKKNASGDYIGEWKFYDESGKLKSKSFFENGKLSGKTTRFHTDGKVSSISYFLNGDTTGQWESYNENGQLKRAGSYLPKYKKTGEWKSYDEKGLVTKIEYYSTGELTKMIGNRYYPNKLLKQKSIVELINGKVVSKKTEVYDEQGKAIEIEN